MRNFILLLATLTLLGCGGGASVSQNQCIASDWETLGYRDGVNGVRSSRLLAHQDACVEHGIIPDRTAYMRGWQEGVTEYCQPNRAFEIGELGQGHDNVCPADMQSQFTAAYREGRRLYLARVEVSNLERLIGDKEHRLETVKAEIVSSAADQLDPMLTPADRVEMLAYTHRLTEEKQRLESEIPALVDELAHKQAELEHLRQTLATVVY